VFEKCVLSREGEIGMAPRTAPARARSPAPARILVAPFTPARPNWLEDMLVTPLETRALRYTLVTFTLRVMFTAPKPWP
jgi:hypothetical protein